MASASVLFYFKVHSAALIPTQNVFTTHYTGLYSHTVGLFLNLSGGSASLLCNLCHEILTDDNFQNTPLHSSVCAHHFMYIMYLFSGLLEDLCSFVLNQKSNLYMVRCVHLSHLFLLLLYYNTPEKNILFHSSLNYCNGNFFPLLYLFLLSVSVFWITEKMEYCKL